MNWAEIYIIVTAPMCAAAVLLAWSDCRWDELLERAMSWAVWPAMFIVFAMAYLHEIIVRSVNYIARRIV